MKYGNYDAWKLATPWDDEPELPEVFETKVNGLFSEDEKLIDQYDTAYERMKNKLSPEDLEDFLDDLVDNLGLECSENDVYIRLEQNERDQYEAAMEEKAEHQMEMRRLRGTKYE